MAELDGAPETPCSRNYFYVGGAYTEHGKMRGQMYVECLRPAQPDSETSPLIFVHGGGQSGTNWLNTPDGRKGWASYFLDHGYTVYLVDSASRGRSAHDPSQSHSVPSAEFWENRMTATKHAGLWPQAALHTQWPGSGRRGDAVFDQYYASLLPTMSDMEERQRIEGAALTALLKRINQPSILLTHSQGAPGGWLAADACPHLVKAIVAVEPNGRPFEGSHPHTNAPARKWGLTDIPITFDPPIDSPSELNLITASEAQGELSAVVLQDDSSGKIVHKLINLAAISVLVECGEASYHAAFDHATVVFMRQAGISCDFIRLEGRGIRGNGHMQMLELNNLAIAAVIREWIEKVTRQSIKPRESSLL